MSILEKSSQIQAHPYQVEVPSYCTEKTVGKTLQWISWVRVGRSWESWDGAFKINRCKTALQPNARFRGPWRRLCVTKGPRYTVPGQPKGRGSRLNRWLSEREYGWWKWGWGQPLSTLGFTFYFLHWNILHVSSPSLACNSETQKST